MANNRVALVQKNIIMSVIQNFLNIFISFLSRVIFVRVLSASYLGINGLFTNILTILSLADLGMGTAMMYNLYKPLAENDEEKIISLIAFFRKIYLSIAGSIFVIGILLIPILPYIINLQEEIPNLSIYYVLSLLNVVISYLFVYRTTLITADQKNYIINKYTMLFKIITFFAQTAVLLLFKNYVFYLVVALVISLISNVFQNRITLKLYPYLKRKSETLEKKERQKIFREVKALFLYRVCGTIQGNTDSILISIFVGTIFVGYYSNYAMMIAQVTSVVTLVFNSIKASVGNLIACNGNKKGDGLYLFNVLELINFWIVSFCSICFIVLFQDFTEISFGEEYKLGFITVIAIVLNFYTSNIRQTLWTFRETTGIFEETKYVTAVTAGINVILSVIMGYIWGITGILIATVISRMIYAFWKEPQVLFNSYFHRSARQYFITYVKRIGLCVVVCLLTIILSNIITINNIVVNFIFKILVCCIVPNIIFLVIFYKSAEFLYIKEKVIFSILRR